MKVLLIEDSRIFRDRLCKVLDEVPTAEVVGMADNETDARQCLGEHEVDVVLLDLNLKSGSGLSVLEHIKAVYRGVTVVVLTNYAEAEYRARCMQLGANHFFDKSKQFNEFCQCLRTVLGIQPQAIYKCGE